MWAVLEEFVMSGKKVDVVAADWRPVTDYPPFLVSPNAVLCRPNWRDGGKTYVAKTATGCNILGVAFDKQGGGTKWITLAYIVARAFLGECPQDHYISHLDGDKFNCRLANLQYRPVTQGEVVGEEWRRFRDTKAEVSENGKVRRWAGTKDCERLEVPTSGVHYNAVYFHQNGKNARFDVHRLVAELWIGPCPPNRVVNHKDGVKANNHYTNLEYLSQADNVRHAVKMGLTAKGERAGSAKLTETQVREIRTRYSVGDVSQEKLGREFGVSQAAVRAIVTGRNWSHLES